MSAKSLPRWRLAARAVVIAALVAKQWTRFWVGWTLLWIRRGGQARRRAWLGRVVVDLFRQLGATFVKVGQIMSTRPDLIPEHISSALAELQDAVGPFPFEAVARTIEKDFGRPVGAVFAEFAPVPLASASVSQVHKARLPDGRVVAVKVRRPNVVELLHLRPGGHSHRRADAERHSFHRHAVPSGGRRGVRAGHLRAARFPHRGPQ